MKKHALRIVLVVAVAGALAWVGGAAGGSDLRGSEGAGSSRSVLGPCDTDIAFGEVVACTIASAGQEKNLTFTGAIGDRIRIRVVKTSGLLDPLTEVKRPNGTAVCAFTFSDDFTCVLDAAGTHTVHIKDASGANTGDFSLTIQRLNAPTGCVALNYGNPGLTGSINAAAEMDCFNRMNVAVGDVLRIRLAETSGILTATIEVIRPDGTTLCGATTANEVTCTADAAGTHRIVVHDSSGTSTGNYAIVLQRLNNPVGCAAVTFGAAPTAATVGAAVETDCFTFTGAVGDKIRIRVIKTSGLLDPLTEVVRPNGTTICAATFSDDFTCVLDAAGTTKILIRDASGPNTGDYSLAIQRLNAPTGCVALNYGNPGLTGSINAAAEMDCFNRMNVAVGDVLRIRLAETSGILTATIEVIRPDGTTLCGATTANEVTCTADAAGTHRIVVHDSSGTSTGNYAIVLQRLNNPVGCAAVTFGAAPTAATVGAAVETDCFTFTGAVGDKIRIRVIKTSGLLDPLTEVVRPNGTTICAATFSDDFTCVLDAAGTTKILIRDASGPNTGDYSLAIQRLNAPTGCVALNYGNPGLTGSINAAAEMDCFNRMNVAVGDVLRIRLAETSGILTATIEVIRPDGTTLCGATTANEVTCTADAAGTHRIVVHDSSGTSTGNYAIVLQRLNNPVGCAAVTFGAAPTAATVGAAVETDCFTFTGAVGDKIRIRVIKTSGLLDPLTEVVRPNGTTICAATFSDDFTCVLDAAGTTKILIRDASGPNTGDYSLAIQRLNAPTGCVALNYGNPGLTGSINAAAEMDCFNRMNVAVGDVLRIRLAETSGILTATIEVIRPDGTTLCGATTANEVTCTADAAGTHRIVVHDSSGTSTGNYAIVLQRLNNPVGCAAVTFGAAPTAATVGAAVETDCFTFTGAVGDKIRIRVIKTSGLLDPLTEVVRPNGTTICAATFSDDFTCVLDAAGTTKILIRDASGPNTGDYSLAIQRLNAPTGCVALNYGNPGLTGSINAAAEMDCFNRMNVAVGDVLRIRLAETSGILTATIEVIRPDGTTLCGATTANEVTCTADAAGTHRIVVHDSSGTSTGNYAIVLQRLNNPVGCAAVTFGAAPTAATVGAAVETDCFTFTGAVGDKIRIRVIKTSGLLDPLTEVVRPNGTTICAATFSDDFTCVLDAAGTTKILIRDASGPNTGDYSLAIQRLNAPTGCVALNYGNPGLTGSINAAAEMDCFNRMNVAVGDVLRIRLAETSGILTATIEVIRPDGTTLCGATTANEVTCTADAAGTHRIVVHDSSGTSTGNYAIVLQRLNNPVGCTTIAYADPALADSISAAGEMDCFRFSGANADVVRIRVVKTSGLLDPLTEVVRPNGTSICASTFSDDFNCTLDTGGMFAIIVRDASGPNTGGYTVNVDKV